MTIPTPHINAKAGDFAETVLLPGDPLRAKFIAENFLTDVRQVNSVRNMLGFTGKYQGKPVSVMGTGMGCASIGIYSHELIRFYGCKNLIRVGTGGALSAKVDVGDIILAQGACTTSNYVRLFKLPGDYAPICSYKLLRRAADAAENLKLKYYVGNVLSSDMYCAGEIIPHVGKTWTDMGVLAVEMESAALYANAAAAGVNALTILTISDSEFSGHVTTAEERQNSFTNMMKLALQLI
ncbi:MAG: purine-nucleoside phosphorylase [Elusimicrobiaceae bacterium]|nr:purine-nucleoside phosphorylase [Elusimicrobiaceae bacterium]